MKRLLHASTKRGERRMNKKRALLDIVKIFQEFSDTNHGLSRKDIEAHLQSRNASVERRTLYRNIQEINEYGIMNITFDGRKYFRQGAVCSDLVIDVLKDMKKKSCTEDSYTIVNSVMLKELSNYEKLEVEKKMK